MEQQQISLKKQKALEKVKRANADDFSEQELFFGIFIMPERYEITILQRRNGYWTVILFLMEVH